MAKKKANKIWLILCVFIIVIGIGYGFENDKNKQPVQDANNNTSKQSYAIKQGTADSPDYTAASLKLHNVVSDALTSTNATVVKQQEEKREVKRQTNAGYIRWHTKTVTVSFNDDKELNVFKNLLQTKLIGNGEIIATQKERLENRLITRIDIGLRDTLGNEPLTMVTDRILLAVKESSANKPLVTASKGMLAIVIDDFGYTGGPIKAFTAIDRPLTFAVLPFHQYTYEAATQGRLAGKKIMLHLPMEALSAAAEQESNTIKVAMDAEDIRRTLENAIANVPGIEGVNNHQGSKATADKDTMRTVMQIIKTKGLFFVDSRTNSGSVASLTAKELGIKTGDNNIFIDNDNGVEAIKNQLRQAGKIAVRDGSIIAIGHARMNTAVAIKSMIPELEESGIKLVFVTQLLE